MAQFLLRNSLNPQKVVRCGITFTQVVPMGSEGEAIWVVEVATDEPHKNGGDIPPEFVNLTTLNNLDQEIEKAVEIISAKIDWTPLEEDIRPPYVESRSPSGYEVSIDSVVEVVLKDILPAAGIDINSIQMTINDVDVTSDLEIKGDPYEYTVKWVPFMRVLDEY